MRTQTKHIPLGLSLGFPAGVLLPSFIATLVLSAGLLFVVQPMVAKMMLPRLGGSPSVWNTSMCFFQAVLLCGYAYAHVLARRAGMWAQAVIHGCVLLVAAAFLPLDLGSAAPPTSATPVLWLVGQSAVTVGPSFFAVSATAPLLQRWFSRSDHPSAADPYFLYAASNAGSLSALLAYPLLVEPNLPLPLQSRLWAAGLALMVAGIAVCWLGCQLRPGAAVQGVRVRQRTDAADRLRWVGYAFVPSALLLAVTAHITTDLAAAPLFWVVPLALYLLTFILAFASRPPLPRPLMLKVQLYLLIPLIVISATVQSLWLIALHLALFFVTAMVCHGELARRRPPVSDLTEFYLCVSLGGVLGGIFDALIAPVVFPDIWEYPLLLVAACLVRPPSAERQGGLRIDVACVLMLSLCLGTLIYTGTVAGRTAAPVLMMAGVMLFRLSERRWWLAGGVAAFLLVEYAVAADAVLDGSRSFFGVHRVKLVENGAIRVLEDGTTIHGATYTAPDRETIPLGYYSQEGPFGHFFAAIAGRDPKTIGVVGLGTGALACYAQPGQNWTFHEIDPLVEKIARDPRYFHFFERCAGGAAKVVLGDARLTLQDVPDGHYNVLIIDAFSSDSIPLHLLTREALALYRRKVAPDGVIVFHTSNRYVELKPVLAVLATDAGSTARRLLDLAPESTSAARLSTEIIAIGQPGRLLDDLPGADGWRDLAANPRAPLWTDDRSDIIGSVRVFGRELRPD
jgi:hypothetical protein